MTSSTRAFAHHRDVYRWRTLIQVGNDWTIRGTVFMINPGSSKPISKDISAEDLVHLNKIDNTADWFNFSIDSTMHFVISLFKQRSTFKGETFTGVVQIFNLINIMSPSIDEAFNRLQNTADNIACTWSEAVDNLVKPIYVGWSGYYKKPLVNENASRILSAIKQVEDINYLETSGFTHPRFLMGFGAKKPKCLAIKAEFFKR